MGGVHIACNYRLVGHSDADVLTHALCDALLGASGLGDIGSHFSDQDVKYRGRQSLWFLEQVLDMIKGKQYQVHQIDSVVIAQTPKIEPYRQKIQERFSEIMELAPEDVSIKAKTNEGIGSVGEKKSIAAWVVCTIKSKS